MANRKEGDIEESDIGAAIAAGTALAEPIVNPHTQGRAAVILPIGYTLVYLERPEAPLRKQGIICLNDIDSFIAYYAQHAVDNTNVYASMRPMQFLAVFNDHGHDDAALPGWRDHRARYAMAHSNEWTIWAERNKKPFDGNEAFAIWLEDNAVDVVTPSPARMMEIALNLRVNQTQSFSTATRLQDGNVKLTYSNDVSGTAASFGELSIPESFFIEIPVFEGLSAKRYRVEARFRYRLESGKLKIHYDLVRPHKVIEQAFRDLVVQVEAETEEKVLFGQPD